MFPYKKWNFADYTILVNVFLYIVNQVVTFFFEIPSHQINTWVGLPQQFSDFLLKPWTIVTYAFFHSSFQHLLWNMLGLYFIGRIFFELFDKIQFITIYFVGILTGAIVFLSINDFLTVFFDNSTLLGASGAIVSLLVFISVMKPNYIVYFFYLLRLRLWILTLLWFLIDVIQLSSSNSGGRIVHLAGASAGFLMAIITQYSTFSKKTKAKKIPPKRPIPQQSFSKITDAQKIKNHQINKILSKISTSGYTSLTDEERKFLFQVSKED